MNLSKIINEGLLHIQFMEQLNKFNDEILHANATSSFPTIRKELSFLIDERTNLTLRAQLLKLDERALTPFINGEILSDLVYIKKDGIVIDTFENIVSLLSDCYNLPHDYFCRSTQETKAEIVARHFMRLMQYDLQEKRYVPANRVDAQTFSKQEKFYLFTLHRKDVYELFKRLKLLINQLSPNINN